MSYEARALLHVMGSIDRGLQRYDRQLDPPDDKPTCSGCLIEHAPCDCPNKEDFFDDDRR